MGKCIMSLLRVRGRCHRKKCALKRMKKGKSSGPSEVTCEMFLNDVCVRELCGVANGLLMGESMPESC